MNPTHQPNPDLEGDFVPYDTDLLPQIDPKAIYWDQRGAIACGEHAPRPGSDTWVWDKWRAMSAQDIVRFRRDIGRGPWCETCGARHRNARRKGAL